MNHSISLMTCREELQQDDCYSRSNSEWKALLQQQRRVLLLQGIARHRKIKKSKSSLPMYNVNQVKVVDKAFLQKSFKAKSKVDRTHISTTISDFSLNEEQEHAFKIVANHSVEAYIRAVANALRWNGRHRKIPSHQGTHQFFERRNQPYLFLILASHWLCSCLVDGSTYHSVLGINGSYAK